MKKERVMNVCQEIRHRGLHFAWECLGRVDALDYATALEMKAAGCTRIFFGIESGNEQILKLMNKKITTDEARQAVQAAHQAGLQVGAFFILCYPGDTDDTVLEHAPFCQLACRSITLVSVCPIPCQERNYIKEPKSASHVTGIRMTALSEVMCLFSMQIFRR